MVGKEFRHKQSLHVIHVWMLHRKLMTLGNDGSHLDECLYDELWGETSVRIRQVGVSELMVSMLVLMIYHRREQVFIHHINSFFDS